MSKELKEYEDYLFGGRQQWKLLPVVCDDGGEFDGEIEAYEVLFMDAEYDPIRVTIDLDGTVVLPAEDSGYDWCMMTHSQLLALAKLAKRVADLKDKAHEAR